MAKKPQHASVPIGTYIVQPFKNFSSVGGRSLVVRASGIDENLMMVTVRLSISSIVGTMPLELTVS
jgi:hypothetical protein